MFLVFLMSNCKMHAYLLKVIFLPQNIILVHSNRIRWLRWFYSNLNNFILYTGQICITCFFFMEMFFIVNVHYWVTDKKEATHRSWCKKKHTIWRILNKLHFCLTMSSWEAPRSQFSMFEWPIAIYVWYLCCVYYFILWFAGGKQPFYPLFLTLSLLLPYTS